MPTYAAFNDNTNTLYVLRPTQCDPEEHAFNNGTDALDWLHVNTPEARTIPILSFNGLLGVRQDRCDEDRIADNT